MTWTRNDDEMDEIISEKNVIFMEQPSLSSSLSWYLGGNGCGGYVGGGAVLGGRHTAVLLFLIFLLTLHTFILCLAAWRTVWRWREGRWWWRQVLQLVCCLLYLHHCVPKKVDGVRQRWKDELEAFLEQIKHSCPNEGLNHGTISSNSCQHEESEGWLNTFECYDLNPKDLFCRWKNRFTVDLFHIFLYQFFKPMLFFSH